MKMWIKGTKSSIIEFLFVLAWFYLFVNIKLDIFSIFHLENYSEQEKFNQLIFHLLESNMHFPFTEKENKKKKIHVNGQFHKNLVDKKVGMLIA